MSLRDFRARVSPAGDFLLEINSQRLYPVSKRERKVLPPMFTSSLKRRIRRFDVVLEKWTSRKCTKKRDALAELLFCS